MAGADAQLDAFRRLFPAPLGDDLAPHVRIVTRRNGQVIIDHQDETSEVFVVLPNHNLPPYLQCKLVPKAPAFQVLFNISHVLG